jgi:single-strand DNA-binding protein
MFLTVFFTGLDPDGCLVADQRKVYAKHLKYRVQRNQPVATFNLAFRSSKKKTCWIKCTCFHRLAEVAEKYLHKGARIALVGTLDVNKWETDEGVNRSSYQLIANSIEFIKTDGRGFENDQSEDDVPI